MCKITFTSYKQIATYGDPKDACLNLFHDSKYLRRRRSKFLHLVLPICLD